MQTLDANLSNLKTDKALAESEIATAQRNPIYLIRSGYLSIITKEGEMVKLELNEAQEILLKKILALRVKRKPVRIWLLKARQMGQSTLVEAIIYALTSQQENRKSLIMADDVDHSTNLFNMTKLYHEKLEEEEPHLAPALKKSNEKALEFENIHSKVVIDTAQNIEAARSATFSYVHLSEVAFFPDLSGVMRGLNQSVPDFWDTIIIGETTANGRDQFYREWLRAIKGETDWIPVFIPWFQLKEYSKPLENGELYPLKGIYFTAECSAAQFIAEEAELQSEHNLTVEQMNWRRFAIINKCGGDLDSFKQEYPATWQESFAMSGSCFFDRRGLEVQESMLETPKMTGEVFYQDMGWEFRESVEGRIRVYEEPAQGEQYIVTLDASEGLPSGDEAAGHVLNKRTNKTAATLNGPYDPEDLAEMGIALANWYNKALVAPENKGYGYNVCQLIFKNYGNIYKRKKKNRDKKTGMIVETEELGYNTNTVTRPAYLAALNSEIKNGSTTLRDKILHSEALTFVEKKDKDGRVTKVEAETGCQDGLLICRAIASAVRQEHPYVKAAHGRTTEILRKRRVNEMRKTRTNAGFGYGGSR